MTEDAIKKTIIDAIEAVDDPAPAELEPLSKSAEALHQILDDVSVWRSPDGEYFASIQVNGHTEHYGIKSREFAATIRMMMAKRFHKSGRPAAISDSSMREALLMLEARAMENGTVQEAPLRVAEEDNVIYVDLGTADWSVAAIDAHSWRTLPSAPIPILRSRRSNAFSLDETLADFVPLREHLSHLDEDSFVLLVAWQLAALMPTGPYPILVLGGEMGSGKSMLARLCQNIVDPTKGDLLQPPESNRDLIAQMKANRVLAFDNCSNISSDFADSLCRASTGVELGGRALYSDYDLATFRASRPIILNGIPDLATRGDLAERCIVVRLPRLPHRKTERKISQEHKTIVPATQVALFDAIRCGLANRDTTPTVQTRMADFCQFVSAAEEMLPWARGRFLEAYERNQTHSIATLAESDPVASAVQRLMEHIDHWTGSVTDLYEELTPQFLPKPSGWPGNPAWLSNRLRRCTPTLRALGIEITECRAAQANMITLMKVS